MRTHLDKFLLLTILPLGLITSCRDNNEETTIDPTFNNIQEGLMKLRSINNFTLNYRINGEEFIKEYSDTAYYSSYDNLGYIKNTSNQVYPFSVEENEIISGEVLQNVTNIYGNELVTTFSDFTFQSLDTSTKIININPNNDRRAFLELVGEDVNKIFDVRSFRLIYGENDLNSFVFDMTLTDGEDVSTIIAELNNVGTTSLSNVNEYLNNGGTYYTPSDDFIRIRELFSNSNYTHNIYGYDENNNEIKIGEEIFTPNYYVTVYDYNAYPEGNAYNNAFYKADNETLTLIDDESGQSATITQNGIYFLEAGAEAVYTYTGAVTNLFIIRDNSIDNTAKLVMTGNNYVKLNNNAEPINSKFVCEGLNLDATAMTNYQVTANGKFGQIVFSNCNINLTTEKAFIYVANTVTDREFDKIIIKNCKFDWTNRTQDKGFQLCNLQTTSIKSSISLVNNVFYAKGKDAKLQIFNFLKKDIPYVEMKNNTFVNAVPLTDGYIKCKSVTSIDIQNNLFYSTNYSSNQLLFRYDNDNADGATISTTGTVSNNFGNKGDKIWKLFYSNNVIEGGTQIDNTKETIFSNMDYDKVIFTPIDELSSCGATID